MLSLTVGLERRGHVVTVVARRGGPIQKRFLGEGCRVLPVVRGGIPALPSLFGAAIAVRREKPNVVHVHRDHDLPIAKMLSMATGAPLLLTQHCLPKRPLQMTYGLADRIVAVSEYIAGGIRRKIPKIAPRLFVVANGIDTTSFSNPDVSYWRPNPLVGDRWPLLGAVGAFYKGQDELVGMLPRLRSTFPNLALVLIGEDEAGTTRLRMQAERLGVADAVVFAGRIPRGEMRHAMAGFDLQVSAFRNEGFGLSVIEGLMVGTPFIGYRAGGYPEIVTDDRFGILVDDAVEFEEAVVRLLKERSVPGSRRVETESVISARYSLNSMVDAYEKAYMGLWGET